mgnify:CR=1 FL=1
MSVPSKRSCTRPVIVIAFATLCASLILLPAQARAQDVMSKESVAELKTAFLADIETMRGKFVGLAEAFPQDKYAWRPMEGVRSVSEVLMLAAMEGYSFIPGSFGGKPADLGSKEEAAKLRTITDKAQIIARTELLRKLTRFESRRQVEEVGKRLEKLRNNLAHSQDIITNDWDTIVLLAENLDSVLDGPPGLRRGPSSSQINEGRKEGAEEKKEPEKKEPGKHL